MEKIKILHLVPGLDVGGISMLLLNYYKKFDRDKIQFDFAIFYDYVGMTGKEFQKMGSQIFFLPPKSKNLYKYIRDLSKIIRENKYDIIHVHQDYMSFLALMIAKKYKVPVRIVHSHTTSVKEGKFQKIYYLIGKTLDKIYATHFFACGEKAGEFLYGKSKNVFVLNNAFDIDKFIFNEEIRKQKRNEFDVKENLSIVTVGRLSEQKNQKYAIDIIEKISKLEKDAKLYMVGDGPLEDELKKYAKEKKVGENIVFLGKREDVNEILQAMDVFILTSFYEGLPVAGLEAIASSIPCVFADTITKELNIRENVEFVGLDDIEKWVDKILEFSKIKRTENSKEILNRNYNIDINAKLLQEKYLKMIEESKIKC